MLAGLDHNLNIDRGFKTSSKEGAHIGRVKIAYQTYSKIFIAKKVRNKKSYHFLRGIALRFLVQR